MGVVLLVITYIFSHKAVKSIDKGLLTELIAKVEFFLVVDEDVGSGFEYSFKISALIHTLSKVEYFRSSVSDLSGGMLPILI